MSLIKIWFWGAVGADVKELQKFLNQHGYVIAKTGVSSPGWETTYFGAPTKKALLNFQKANKIKPADGVFNPATRAVVNKMANPLKAQNVKPPTPVKTKVVVARAPAKVPAPLPKVPRTYQVRGSATGVSEPVILRLNGLENLAVIPGKSDIFYFTMTLADGAAYSVTAASLAANQKCYLADNKGIVRGANVTGLKLSCYLERPAGPSGTTVMSGSGSGGGSSASYIDSFSLSYSAGTCGVILGTASQTVNRGADGSVVTVVTASGCHFVDWSDGSTANPRTDMNVSANISVTANYLNIIDLSAIAGVTAPVIGAAPTSTLAATSQYTAAISWSPATTTFAPGTAYAANVAVTPKAGYTLNGVPANFFTVAGAAATSSINTGAVRAIFPSTAATIDHNVLSDVQMPAAGAAAYRFDSDVDASTEYDYAQYRETVTFSPDSIYHPAKAYTAVIDLMPKPGYTLTGVPSNFFVVPGATASNTPNSGAVLAFFPATSSTIATAVIAGVTAPVAGVMPTSTIASTAEYNGAIAWSPADSPFGNGVSYTATITLAPKAGYTLYGVPANFFTVAGATTTNSINAGVVTAHFPATANDWIPGLAGTYLETKYIYKQDLASTYAWKTTSDLCELPQCDSGTFMLVSPQASPGIDFSAYPAQNACKAVGGRLPTETELFSIYGDRASYGDNFAATPPSYWSSMEYSNLYAYDVTVAGDMDNSGKTGLERVRCIKD